MLTDERSGYLVDPDALEAARTERTKALLFCSPSNPTGAVYPPSWSGRSASGLVERGLWVVTDEIYEHLVYGGAVFASLPVQVPELADRTIVLNGVAKTYAMTGWRVGWMVGPTDVVAAATNLQSHLSSNVANVSQRAALSAVTGDLSAVAAMREAFDRRRRTIVSMLSEIDGIVCPTRTVRSTSTPRCRACSGARSAVAGRRRAPSSPPSRSTRWRWPSCRARRSGRAATCGCPTRSVTTTSSRVRAGSRSCSARRAEVAPVRAGIVGYGLAGRVIHGQLLAGCPDVAVVGVVTRNPERAAQVAADFPAARAVPDVDALLGDDGGVDLVVVATTNDVHAATARAALDAGAAVVVDKPLAVDAAEARELVAHAAGRALTVFQNRRWDSDQLTLARLLGSGELGAVWRHETRFERFRPALDPGKWREVVPAAEGGGQLLDLGSHLVDQAVQLFGPVTAVVAEVEQRRGGGDDAVFLALAHAGGVRSHCSLGAVFGSPGPRRRVLGDAGALVVPGLDVQEDQLRAEGPLPGEPGFGVEPEAAWPRLVRGEEAVPVEPERGGWDGFYPAVVAALRTGGRLPVDPADAVAVLEVLEAARRSAEHGTVERLAV